MCGIAAILAYSPDAPSVERGELVSIRDRMLSRGPDGAGEWISPDQRVGLAHRRLAIIDLSPTGAQPMAGSDGRFVITFNGEIYNYRELRHRLEQRGCQFRSQSDTEVLLHLYAEKGADMVNDLRGMYAFAIWDGRERGLFLARDPFGIKPLYYADNGRTIRVASQVKALLRSGHIDTTPEPAGHVGFFIWGSVPEPFTLYRGIRALPAGNTMWIDASGCGEPKSFCSVPKILLGAAQCSISNSQFSILNPDFLREALRDTVEHHLIADVPVGVFLSAGLDSTTLAAFASSKHPSVQTVTLGFEEYRNTPQDEVPLAETVARTLGTRHQTMWITRDDFARESENLFDAMDQPATDGVNTYFVSLAARRAGLKVVLSGLGGDEIFAGYPSFRDVPRAVNALRHFQKVPALGRAWRVVSAPILKRLTSPKYAGLLEYGPSYGGAYLLRRGMFMPWELPEVLDPDLAREGWRRLNTLSELKATANLGQFPLSLDGGEDQVAVFDPKNRKSKFANQKSEDRLRVSALELCWYMRHQLLRDSDWASMAHSLELRVPLVDVTLLRTLAPLLASDHAPTKLDMARSSTRPLPDAVLNRPKTGFTIPVREWLLQGVEGNVEHRTSNIEHRKSADRGLRAWAKHVYARFVDNSATTPERRIGNRKTRIEDEPAQAWPNPLVIEAGDARNSKPRVRISKSVSPQRILVYRIGQLGDTIVALPSMWAVRKSFPAAHIALLCDRHPKAGYVQAADLLDGSGLFDEYIGYPASGNWSHRAFGVLRLLRTIKERRFDTLIYLAPTGRSPEQIRRDKTFFRAGGIRNFMGATGFVELEPKRSDKPLKIMRRESELLLDRLFDLPAVDLPPCFDLNLGVRESDLLRKWLEHQKSDDGRQWIGVAPGSKMPAKRWPLERYEKVVRALIDRFDIWPVVLGGPEDRAIGEELLNRWQRGYNAAGALEVRTAALALKQCAVYVGNDTGTMHLAAAVGVPCVAIFSAREWPGLWHPTGKNHRLFRSKIDCEGCGLIACVERNNECLRKIEVGDVVEAAAQLMIERSIVCPA